MYPVPECLSRNLGKLTAIADAITLPQRDEQGWGSLLNRAAACLDRILHLADLLSWCLPSLP